uniref:Uncharacterized protein n=1 Tax=Caudovirales sp. ctlwr10 TaxID=2825771 RepID=A0A8S5Q507_9CAUD|nr:MAG TPA: hypothetical protein [Caudovirales sp. ctlwr10]
MRGFLFCAALAARYAVFIFAHCFSRAFALL